MVGIQSLKRNLVVKLNTTIVAVTASASFVVVFCVVASVSLADQFMYQNRIIGADKAALKQLKSNVQTALELENAYDAFVKTPTNIIGGDPKGSGPQDGSNTKIVLDALPSKYDYPALVTGLENLLSGQSVQIQSISGTDEAVTQASSQTSPTPTSQPMPFQIVVSGNYASIQNVVRALERSVRPFQIQSMEVAGDQSNLTLTIVAQTYWQPTKNLHPRTEVIK